MAGRSNIFSRESLATLFADNPGLTIFEAKQWDSYLELTSEIYDFLDSSDGPVESGVIESKIRTYFSDDVEDLDQKVLNFFGKSIVKWRTLKDFHDSNGTRYVTTTPEGRAFLSLIEQQLLGRPQFTGFGADRLLGSLNKILSRQDTMSEEDAIEHHKNEIKKWKEDIDLIKRQGVKASKLLSHQVTPVELFTEAEQAAMSVLVAQDAVKNKIKSVRVELFEGYTTEAESVGRRIELTADFYRTLRATDEYQSYDRARDALSYVEGLSGAMFAHKEIPRMLADIAKLNVLDPKMISNSPLQRFQTEFEMINDQIDEEVRRQINILKLQVYYATSGDGRLVQENLRKLTSLILENETKSADFVASLDLSYEAGLNIELGIIEPNSLDVPERIKVGGAVKSEMSDDEYREMVEAMRKSEEASIKQVLDKVKTTISQDGVVVLSDYPITMGALEYYVLARVECFDRALKSVSLPPEIDLLVNNKRNERLWIRQIPDVVIEVARS
ncbi:MAG: hypothetical protein HC902_08610 [Calothrix sp. SM1_5_4]|nr:hypothetical protein [Calothrix sp. SM1_5_4]